VWVTLLAVQDLPRSRRLTRQLCGGEQGIFYHTHQQRILLVFAGSSPLPQSTNLFEHDVLGRFALFTVPEGNGQQLYNAVVNRLDGAHVIAVPFATGKVAQQNQAGASAGANVGANNVRVSSPTSSTDESLSPALSGSQALKEAQ